MNVERKRGGRSLPREHLRSVASDYFSPLSNQTHYNGAIIPTSLAVRSKRSCLSSDDLHMFLDSLFFIVCNF